MKSYGQTKTHSHTFGEEEVQYSHSPNLSFAYNVCLCVRTSLYHEPGHVKSPAPLSNNGVLCGETIRASSETATVVNMCEKALDQWSG